MVGIDRGFHARFKTYYFCVDFGRITGFFFIVFIFRFFSKGRDFIRILMGGVVRVRCVYSATTRAYYGILTDLAGCSCTTAYRVFATIFSCTFCGYEYAKIAGYRALTYGAVSGYDAANYAMGNGVACGGVLFYFMYDFFQGLRSRFAAKGSFSGMIVAIANRFRYGSFKSGYARTLSTNAITICDSNIVYGSIFVLSNGLYAGSDSRYAIGIYRVCEGLYFLAFVCNVYTFLGRGFFVRNFFRFRVVCDLQIGDGFLIFTYRQVIRSYAWVCFALV